MNKILFCLRRPAMPLSILFAALMLVAPAFAAGYELEKKVQEATLDNGIRVIMMPRVKAPTVALRISFAVGSMMEEQGRTGVAHLLEHVMFKGTHTIGTTDYKAEAPIIMEIDQAAIALDNEKRRGQDADPAKIKSLSAQLKALQEKESRYIIPDALSDIYTRNGGEGLNASTGYDMTSYHLSLPNTCMELWASLESDRIQNAVFREFYQERDVVLEERRQRTESSPEGKLMEKFLAAAFLAHPYRRPILGWDSDIRYLNRPIAEEFYRRNYHPSRMVITMVGDFDPKIALPLLKKYFERLPVEPRPPAFYPSEEPAPGGGRRVEVIFDARPQIIIGYQKSAPPHPDDYVMDVISSILSSGRTSRLYRKLVEETRLCQSISTGNGFPGSRYRNLFIISAASQGDHSSAELEKAILKELDLLQTEPVTDWELQKTSNEIEAGIVRALDSDQGMAEMLSDYETSGLGWRYLATYADNIRRITAADIKRVAAKYFQPDNRVVGVIIPPPPGGKVK